MRKKYIPPFCPSLHGIELDSVASLQDALTACESSLYLLADLFGGKMESYSILDTDRARHGMWLQLYGLAGTLEAINAQIDRRLRGIERP